MKFFIYHDKISNEARVHHGWCPAAQYGRGMHGHQKRDENCWHSAQQADIPMRAVQWGVAAILTGCETCSTVVERSPAGRLIGVA